MRPKMLVLDENIAFVWSFIEKIIFLIFDFDPGSFLDFLVIENRFVVIEKSIFYKILDFFFDFGINFLIEK